MNAETNVELVRRFFEVHNTGGGEAVLAAYDTFFDPDWTWSPAVVGGLEGESYRGRDGLRRWYAERDEAFQSGTVEIESCRAIAPDVVVVLARNIARGRASGAALDEEVGIVVELREGRIVSNRAYGSHSEAEEAAQARA